MFNYTLYFTIAGSTALVMLIGILLGGWLMFKGNRSAKTNESFIGRSSKGEVFSILDDSDSPDYPEGQSKEEGKILERTNKFLKALGGN